MAAPEAMEVTEVKNTFKNNSGPKVPNFSYDIWVHTAIAYIMNFGIDATPMTSRTNFVKIDISI